MLRPKMNAEFVVHIETTPHEIEYFESVRIDQIFLQKKKRKSLSTREHRNLRQSLFYLLEICFDDDRYPQAEQC